MWYGQVIIASISWLWGNTETCYFESKSIIVNICFYLGFSQSILRKIFPDHRVVSKLFFAIIHFPLCWIMLEMDAFISTSLDLPELCRQTNTKEPYWLYVLCHDQLNLAGLSIRGQNGDNIKPFLIILTAESSGTVSVDLFCNVCETSACNRSLICDYLHLF